MCIGGEAWEVTGESERAIWPWAEEGGREKHTHYYNHYNKPFSLGR